MVSSISTLGPQFVMVFRRFGGDMVLLEEVGYERKTLRS